MGMTFDDMLTFVRTQADTDATDASSTILTVHARIAYNDILSRRSAWDHLEVHYALPTVADQQEYDFPTSGVDTMDSVYSITMDDGLRRRLVYVTRQDADLMYGISDTTGTPQAYTLYGSKIVLYPTPSGVVNLTVHGFRAPHTWPAAAGDEPDLPDEFHDAIAWYMLSGYYLSQEDTQLAGVYLQEYNGIVQRCLEGTSGKNFGPRPKVMGARRFTVRTFNDRVAGMLEG